MEGLEIKITMDDILRVFKNAKEEKRPKDIKSSIIAMHNDEELFINPEVEAIVDKQVDDLLRADKKLDKSSYLIYNKGKYKKRNNRRPFLDTDVPEENPINTDYTGRAGECAVMSELLFRGYNANHMMVDDGVDVIATKDNTYYYVQVKTASVRKGRIYCKIGLGSFDRYINTQIRYIIVARYKDKSTGVDHNLFFKFTPDDIERFVYEKCILKGENGYNIKIKFNELNNDPILYDEKERGISWNMNKFDL